MNIPEIENRLRNGPQLQPPPGLKQRLAAQAPAMLARHATQSLPVRRNASNWLARWWPALGPGAVSLACAALFTVQQMEINKLQKAAAPEPLATVSSPAVSEPAATEAGVSSEASGPEQEEIARLKELVASLSADVSRLEQIQIENQGLRQQLAADSTATLTPDEAKALEDARARALSIQCVNNLKQLGLSARVWAMDNGDQTPPGILSMTNEMSTPKILACPADTAHPAATGGWANYSAANCSYEYLAPSAPDFEPNRVMFRCPLHGHITLCDGSVMSAIAKDRPESLVQKDGKLYYQPSFQ